MKRQAVQEFILPQPWKETSAPPRRSRGSRGTVDAMLVGSDRRSVAAEIGGLLGTKTCSFMSAGEGDRPRTAVQPQRVGASWSWDPSSAKGLSALLRAAGSMLPGQGSAHVETGPAASQAGTPHIGFLFSACLGAAAGSTLGCQG